jgi:hypothetical protein
VIEQKLTAATAVIVIMTPAGDESNWVGRELDKAEELGLPVFPILLAGTPFFRIRDVQWLDARAGTLPREEFVAQLQRLLATTAKRSRTVDGDHVGPAPRYDHTVQVGGTGFGNAGYPTLRSRPTRPTPGRDSAIGQPPVSTGTPSPTPPNLGAVAHTPEEGGGGQGLKVALAVGAVAIIGLWSILAPTRIYPVIRGWTGGGAHAVGWTVVAAIAGVALTIVALFFLFVGAAFLLVPFFAGLRQPHAWGLAALGVVVGTFGLWLFGVDLRFSFLAGIALGLCVIWGVGSDS